MNRTSRLGLWWVVMAVALGLRLWTLGDKNLWLDESSSWTLARSTVTQVVSLTAADTHPPFYFLTLKAWIAIFGDSAIALRSLSLAAGMVALYLTFRLAVALFPPGVAYAVTVWFAVSPHATYFSQEARMYALATAAVLAACVSYRRWVDSGFTSRAALIAYGGSATAGLYLHYFTALPMVAIWLHAMLLGRRAFPWKSWFLAHAGIGILYAPWLGQAVEQIARGQPWWRQPVALVEVPGYAAALVRELTFSAYGVPIVGSVSGAVAVVVLGVGWVSVAARAIRTREERDGFVALVALTPVLLALALLPVAGEMELSRYLSYATPLLVLAAASGLGAFGLRPNQVTGILLIGSAAVLPSLWTYYRSPAKDSDLRPIVAYLDEMARRGPGPPDPILVAPGYMTSLLRDVSRGHVESHGVNAGGDLRGLRLDVPPRLHARWLIVDYRWPGFETMARDPRFTEQHVPGGMPDRIKLFRIRGASRP